MNGPTGTGPVGLVTGSVVLTLLVLELGARLFAPHQAGSPPVYVFTCRNFVTDHFTALRNAYPVTQDAELGWVPRAGTESHNPWGTRVSIDDEHLRTNGPAARARVGRSVLLVGDSFAFGDEVNDDETVAAQLESLLDRPVLNAGVFGYGIDQAVMRAELLSARHAPATVVLVFVPDDIDRTNFSMRAGVEKPWFDVGPGGKLRQHDVPTFSERPGLDIGAVRAVLGYSYFADWLMRRLGHDRLWYVGQFREERVPGGDWARGVDVSCRLLIRLHTRLQAESTDISSWSRTTTVRRCRSPPVPSARTPSSS